MASAIPPAFREEQLDVQGQNARLDRLYTQLCLCFSLDHTNPQTISDVTAYLQDGLRRLAMSFPWVVGHVVEEDSVFKIKPCEDSPTLSVKDLREQLPPFQEYQSARFPFSMLDENTIAPRNTLPERFGEPAPVILLRATFVEDGILLVLNGQHNCMDIRGQAQIMHLLAKACRGEDYTSDELQTGNMPRADIIPLLENTNDPQPKPTPSQNARDTKTATSIQGSNATPQSRWAYFLFSRSSLASLKKLAVESVSSGYVSTDDVLSAFIWQAITRAHLARFGPGTAGSTLDRQVDARKFLGIPTAYTGNVVHKVSTTLIMQRVIEMSLGTLASHLRTCLQSTNIAYEVRRAAIISHQATLARRSQPSRGSPSASRGTLPSTDVRISSWAKEDCYHLDFGGLLGKPEAVRRPDFQAWEGLVYFLPKKADGEIAVALCLREEDLARLRGDEIFTDYCSNIG